MPHNFMLALSVDPGDLTGFAAANDPRSVSFPEPPARLVPNNSEPTFFTLYDVENLPC